MSHPFRRATTRLAKPAAAIAALAVVAAGCASDSEAEASGFADDAAGGGTDSVVFAEQPWVDLQVENEIAVQILDRLGYDASIKRNLSVENAASALGTGDLDAYLGNWWPSQEPTFGELIDDGKVDVVSTIVTGTEYAPAVPGDVADELGVSSLADLDEHADEFDRKIYGIEAGSPGNETIQKRHRRGRLRPGGLGAGRQRHAGDARAGREVPEGRRPDRIPCLEPALDDGPVRHRVPRGPGQGVGRSRRDPHADPGGVRRGQPGHRDVHRQPGVLHGRGGRVLLRPRQGRAGPGRDRLCLDQGQPRQGRVLPPGRRRRRWEAGRRELSS